MVRVGRWGWVAGSELKSLVEILVLKYGFLNFTILRIKLFEVL